MSEFKVKMENVKIINANNAMRGMTKSHVPVPTKFAYALGRNIQKLDTHIKALTMVEEVLAPYRDAISKARKKLDDGFIDPEKPTAEELAIAQPEMDVEVDKLKKKHQPEIDEWDELLKVVVDVDFYPMNVEHFPPNIKPIDMDILMPFIVDSAEQQKPADKPTVKVVPKKKK